MLSCSNGNKGSYKNGIEYSRQQRGRNDLEKDVLVSLFNAQEKSEVRPARSPAIVASKRSRAVGEVVAEPLTDPTAEHKTDAMYPQQDSEDGIFFALLFQVSLKALFSR